MISVLAVHGAVHQLMQELNKLSEEAEAGRDSVLAGVRHAFDLLGLLDQELKGMRVASKAFWDHCTLSLGCRVPVPAHCPLAGHAPAMLPESGPPSFSEQGRHR